jgi:hypothetical protein
VLLEHCTFCRHYAFFLLIIFHTMYFYNTHFCLIDMTFLCLKLHWECDFCFVIYLLFVMLYYSWFWISFSGQVFPNSKFGGML